MTGLLLAAAFALIIGGAILFTNAIEWSGKRLDLEGPTALPPSTQIELSSRGRRAAGVDRGPGFLRDGVPALPSSGAGY